ncbi:MAG: FecR domain-containing protein [Chryseolinea sp.]
MNNRELIRLLDKYSRGECTEDEQASLEHWYLMLEKNPDDSRIFDRQQESLLAQKMLRSIKARILQKESKSAPFHFRILIRIAASLLIVAIIGGALFYYRTPIGSKSQQLTFSSTSPSVFVQNTSSSPKRYALSDGTVVILQPKGGLTYPPAFDIASRKVQLTGEAFFDVAKDSARPFIIATNNITVRVLGTSFNVKSYEGAAEAVVAVKSGKVSVKRPQHHPDGRDEVILTPNQEVIYNTANEKFQKKIVATPLIILAKPTLFEMQYDETPVDKIFEVLEENYGIDIIYDSKILSSCTLTTSMSEEGFYERIKIICEAIGARYEMHDGGIVIKSSGCQ